MPRFVVQHHVLSADDEHWDLMFESGPVLWTWSLPVPPECCGPSAAVHARHLAAHRIIYLDYEGDLSGGRGRVEIHDRGTYQWIGDVPESGPDVADVLLFELQGDRAAGRYRLSRTPDDGKDLWRLSALR